MYKVHDCHVLYISEREESWITGTLTHVKRASSDCAQHLHSFYLLFTPPPPSQILFYREATVPIQTCLINYPLLITHQHTCCFVCLLNYPSTLLVNKLSYYFTHKQVANIPCRQHSASLSSTSPPSLKVTG